MWRRSHVDRVRKTEHRGSGSSAESRSGEKSACLRVWVAEWVREALTEGLRNLLVAIHCILMWRGDLWMTNPMAGEG